MKSLPPVAMAGALGASVGFGASVGAAAGASVGFGASVAAGAAAGAEVGAAGAGAAQAAKIKLAATALNKNDLRVVMFEINSPLD